MLLNKAVCMAPLPVLNVTLDHDYFSSMCRMRALWKMFANRSSNIGQNGTANQLPKESVVMVFNFICHLIIILAFSFFHQKMVCKRLPEGKICLYFVLWFLCS